MARRGCAGDTLAPVTRLPRYFFTSAVLVISLATSVCFVSNNLNSRVQHRDETVAQQVALITKAPLPFDGQLSDEPEFRNRACSSASCGLQLRRFPPPPRAQSECCKVSRWWCWRCPSLSSSGESSVFLARER